jgi:hypothetical protein
MTKIAAPARRSRGPEKARIDRSMVPSHLPPGSSHGGYSARQGEHSLQGLTYITLFMEISYVSSSSQDQLLDLRLKSADALGEKFNWCPVAPTNSPGETMPAMESSFPFVWQQLMALAFLGHSSINPRRQPDH